MKGEVCGGGLGSCLKIAGIHAHTYKGIHTYTQTPYTHTHTYNVTQKGKSYPRFNDVSTN